VLAQLSFLFCLDCRLCFAPDGSRLREVAVLDPDFIRELFAPFRHVDVKRMFGGAGLFADGLMFGLVFDGVIYLKADAASIPDFEREGSAPFTYQARSRPRSLNFWRLPERLYDDPDDLAVWAGRALAIVEARTSAPRGRTPKQAAPKKSPPKARTRK
jgi:DNA transformation protein and related proteins